MEIILRASAVFWLLWMILRAAGKRELGEMTPFELIVLMVMGDVIQQGVTEEDMSFTGAALAVTTIMMWTLGLSYLNFRNKRLSEALESKPAILVSDGEVDEEMLKVHRLSHDDLLDEARNAGISRISDVRYSVLEADGKVSFIRMSEGDQDAQVDAD